MFHWSQTFLWHKHDKVTLHIKIKSVKKMSVVVKKKGKKQLQRNIYRKVSMEEGNNPYILGKEKKWIRFIFPQQKYLFCCLWALNALSPEKPCFTEGCIVFEEKLDAKPSIHQRKNEHNMHLLRGKCISQSRSMSTPEEKASAKWLWWTEHADGVMRNAVCLEDFLISNYGNLITV